MLEVTHQGKASLGQTSVALRPPIRFHCELVAFAKALHEGKHGIHKIATKHSVGVGVVQRI
jgi:hypothetical protein